MWSQGLILIFLLVAQIARADLIVLNPSELANKFDLVDGQHAIQSKLSNNGIGSIQRGATRIGQVIMPKKKDTDGWHDMRGCRPFTWEDFDLKHLNFEPDYTNPKANFFLLLNRGGCSFQKKA